MNDVWTWATVTDDDPLAIRLDGEADPLTTSPETLVAGLAVGNRVRVHLSGRQAVVHGRAGGEYNSGWLDLTIEAGYTETETVQIRRIGQIVYMRGVVTPTTNWGASGTTSTIVAASGIPADMRPASVYAAIQGAIGTSVAHGFRLTPATDGSLAARNDVASSTSGIYLGGVSWPVG